MNIDTRHYAEGTSLTQRYPWGLYVAGRAMCSDGKVRALHTIAETADTFFSVPASVVVWRDGRRYTVAGYFTVQCVSGSSVETPDDPAIVRFIAYTYRKNGWVLP